MNNERAKEALIMVDVQNDFCPGGSLAVNEGDRVVTPLNKMAKWAREKGMIIIATRDWHPAKTTHFAQFGGIWPDHCVQGTFGGEFHKDLDLSDAVIFSKGMGETEDAYSGFEGRNNEGLTLDQFLKEHRVKKVYVGGLATDYCVKMTALDASRLGYDTAVLTDAIKAVNLAKNDGEYALDEMREAFVQVTTTEDVIKGWVNK